MADPAVSSGFDVAGARKAGYSDDDILQHLTSTRNFDVSGAVKAGYSKPEIIDHLASTPAPNVDKPAPKATFSLSNLASDAWENGPIQGFVNLAKGAASDLGGTAKSYIKELVGAPGSGRAALLDQALTGKPGNGSTADRVVTGINSLIPFVGTGIQKGAEKGARGDWGGAFGTAIGIGSSLAAPDIMEGAANALGPGLRSAVQRSATSMQRQVLKPSKSVEGTADTATSMREGLSGTEGGVSKLGEIKNQVGAQLGNIYRGADQVPVASGAKVADALDSLAAKKGVASNADAATVQAVKDEFLSKLPMGDGLTPSDAFDLKKAHQDKVTELKAGAYKTGADNGALVSAHQEIASNLGDQLVKAFPEAKDLNARYSALSSLEPTLIGAANRSANSGTSTVAAIASIVQGAAFGHPIAGVAGSAALKLLLDPATRSRVAIQIAKTDGVSLPVAQARIGAAMNVAGQPSGSDQDR